VVRVVFTRAGVETKPILRNAYAMGGAKWVTLSLCGRLSENPKTSRFDCSR